MLFYVLNAFSIAFGLFSVEKSILSKSFLKYVIYFLMIVHITHFYAQQ